MVFKTEPCRFHYFILFLILFLISFCFCGRQNEAEGIGIYLIFFYLIFFYYTS